MRRSGSALSLRTAVALGLLLAFVAQRAGAQRPKRTSSRPGASSGSTKAPIRAELAAVLLQSGRYAEAAREYRLLLQREPRNRLYRLNLARALAWGNEHEEAERLLTDLHGEQPGDASIAALLRSTRDAFEPSAARASVWVGEDPSYAPYRLALARALARERLLGLAAAQYDTLIARPGYGTVPSPGTLRVELAAVYASSGDRVRAASVLRDLLAVSPGDTAVRHALAVQLADANDPSASLAQYDTLVRTAPTGALFVERARVHLQLHDESAARADLASGLAIAPSRSGYALLADLHRKHGKYAEARTALLAALAARDTADMSRASVVAALGSLAREARPGVLAPTIGDDPGWLLDLESASDNLGVWYGEISARRAAVVPGGLVVAVGAEARSLRERSGGERFETQGVGANVGVSREASIGRIFARVGGRVGALQHSGIGTLREWELSGAGWVNAWELALTASERAAYQSLFTTTALVDPVAGPSPIMERSTAATLGGPIGPADVALTVERSRLSDGNTRVTFQAYSRYRLAEHLFAVYAASTQQFAERSARYWDPTRYVANGAGVELATRRPTGFSFAARVIPGIAVSNELVSVSDTLAPAPALPDENVRRSAMQLTAGGDASYRTNAFDAGASLAYGRGRAGDYQRLGASVWIRWAP